MKKRIFTCVLAALLVSTTLLTGCGNKPADNGASSTAPADIYTEKGTYPVVKEKGSIELKVFTPQLANITDMQTNDTTKFMEEKTGLKFVFETAPSDAVTEKVNLVLASGDLPDFFYGVAIDDAKYGVAEKLIIPLDELVDNQMVELPKIFEENPTMRGAISATDGKMYQLPAFNDCYHCTLAEKMWVNTMQLEKMGEKVPTTTDEFYNVCKKFLEQNPNGLPLIGGDNWNGDPTHFIVNAFTYRGDSQYGIRLKDKKIETMIKDDEYREALKYMNKLYTDGLLYEGAFTMSADQVKATLVEEGEPVLFFPGGASVNLIDSATTAELYSHYYPIAPLKGPKGVQYASYIPSNPYGGLSITKDCKYPEAVVRFADYVLTFEGGMEVSVGRKDVDWKIPADGDLGLNGEKALSVRIRPYSQEPQNVNWQDLGFFYAPTKYRLGQATAQDVDIFSTDGLEKMLYQASKEEYEPYIPKDYAPQPKLAFLTEENDALQTISVELSKFIKESAVGFVTGAQDINDDAAWATYTKGITDMGMDKLVTTYQTAYDRQYK